MNEHDNEITVMWLHVKRHPFEKIAFYRAGIWGGKGQGKSFQTELIFQAMGVEPVIMSAGELESERAGKMSLQNVYVTAFITLF